MATSTATTDALRDVVSGPVIGPDDPGYDEAREVFYGGIDRRPGAIARVATDDDIRRVVMIARKTGAELAVRAGGHSVAGHSASEGGIILDLRDLKQLDVHKDDRVAVAGPGLTAAEYTAAVGAEGLATGFGDTGSVGIGGITLGGGVGFLVRKHGLTIDSLLGADIVTADGELVTVDAESHGDLFWAIRGGGGNFGVAARLRYRLHPVDRIVGGMLFLPATPEVVEGFMVEAARAGDDLSTIANVMTAPPMPFIPAELHGSSIVMAFLVYAGDVDAGEAAIAPFRALAEPLADMVRPMAYPEMYPPEPEAYEVLAASHTGFVDAFDDDDASAIIEWLGEPVGQARVVQLRTLGGATATVPEDATAFAHRSRAIMVNIATLFQDETEREASQSWVDTMTTRLHGGDATGYVNFLGDEPDRVRHAYPGATWDRLRAVKARYDPTNLFRLNQNIPPA
jgi:FAD/FMN-containing dehydrogenase